MHLNVSADDEPIQKMELVTEKTKPQFLLQQYAIEGRGLIFYYGRNKQTVILKGVDISVNKGVIYGLLGPSGCGKTTLLKCLIGRLKPHDGTIRIDGKDPKDPSLNIPGRGIGYMPQELALYSDMSTKETLIYFGGLYSMEKQVLKARIRFLLDLLEIPNENSLIKNLSGGQKRRVSFACALIHQPPLLILDEPTVGVDPLLRFSMWEHLKELATHNRVTIIITTHYVEEAREANTVALMRNGYILTEKNPETLIQEYEVPALEDVFLKLCQKDISESMNESGSPLQCNSLLNSDENYKEYENHSIHNKTEYDENIQQTGFLDYSRKMRAIMTKCFTCLRRNKLFALCQIVVPVIEIILFCVCVGSEPFDLKFAIVNKEVNGFGFTKTFLDSLGRRTLNQIEYDNLPQALNAVKRGEVWGAMYIGKNFSTALMNRVLEGTNVDNKTIHEGVIRLYLDFTNTPIALRIITKIMEVYQDSSEQMLKNIYENPQLIQLPVKIETAVYGTENINPPQLLAPGISILITNLFAVGLTALSIMLERNGGLFDRCWIAGATAFEMISAVMATLFITMVCQLILTMLLIIFVFNLNILGSSFWLFICLLLSGTYGMAFGLFLSTICSEEITAMFYTMGSYYPIFMMSGVIWPVDGMPYYLRYITYCLPLTMLCDTANSIVFRGWSISQYSNWIGCMVPITWTAVFIVASLIILKVKL